MGHIRRALCSAELEEASRRLPAAVLLRVSSAHPDNQNRAYLSTLSEQGFRIYFLFQRRERLFNGCAANNTQRRERLWQEMTRLKAILNCFLRSEISGFQKYPLDMIFVDGNRDVYALPSPWEPRPEDRPEIPGTTLEDVIERFGPGDPI